MANAHVKGNGIKVPTNLEHIEVEFTNSIDHVIAHITTRKNGKNIIESLNLKIARALKSGDLIIQMYGYSNIRFEDKRETDN